MKQWQWLRLVYIFIGFIAIFLFLSLVINFVIYFIKSKIGRGYAEMRNKKKSEGDEIELHDIRTQHSNFSPEINHSKVLKTIVFLS